MWWLGDLTGIKTTSWRGDRSGDVGHSMGIPGNDYLIKQKGLSKNATTEVLL